MSKVLYYVNADGENPFSDFLDSLTKIQQTKILRIISNIKVYGLSSILPHVKKLAGTPFWEIRILGQDNIRVVYVCLVEETVLVLHGFIKKSQKTPMREIEVSLKRYQEWRQREH